MWARLYDAHDGDTCVAVEWIDPDDGPHYVEIWNEKGYDPAAEGRNSASDSLAAGSLEDWGYEAHGFQTWQPK